MSLQSQLDVWLASPVGSKKLIQIERVDESSQQIDFRLAGIGLQLQVPKDDECVFELECESVQLSELHSIVATFAFEQEGVTLSMILDKIVQTYSKLFPTQATAAAASGSASATALAPASSAASASAPAPKKSTGGSSMEVDSGNDGFGVEDGEGDDPMDEDGFGDDGDGDGDEGWGDFKEANADEEVHDTKWAKEKELKKRLIAKAEAVRVAAAHATEQQRSGKDGIKSIFTSEAATTMLVKDCMSFMASSDPSLRVEPVNESVFQWKVRMANFAPESKIQQGLLQLKQQFHYDWVELEIRFMPDLYPFFPPSVRLVRPRMRSFMIGRLVCMPEIQLSSWNPTRTLHDIFESIRRVITHHGEVDDSEPEVNDPDSELQPYTALEFELLRLTMLTDIAPRVVKTMADAEAMKLFAPKSKPKEEKDKSKAEKDKAEKEAATQHSNYYGQVPQGGGFKKGTGYGGGVRDSAGWDVEQWRAAQMKRESEIVEIAHALAMEMEKATVPTSLAVILENSCLLPFLQEYLANDSISDMEQHPVINHSILDICKNMAKHRNLIRLFELLPGEKKSLASYISDLRASASVVAKFEKFNPKSKLGDRAELEESAANPTGYDVFSPSAHVSKKSKVTSAIVQDKYPISLLHHILQVAEIVETAVATYRSQQSTGHGMIDVDGSDSSAASSSAAAGSSSGSTAASSTPASIDYVSVLAPFRFGEVDNFTSHHYFKQYTASASAPSRAWVKRLATEYADLNKSLPIHPLSSTWLRYKEDAMAFCQFLIAAPDETPYGFGLFLFDSYFPAQYPNVPPLVNLQTTGNGSVRFNPNLYNCGKVCLSLLGTWSGAAGENWSALTSTFLQVIVSIQSLILVPEPYFNEPGYQSSYGTPNGQAQSDAYNKVIQVATIKFAMIDMMKKPPAWAKEIVRSHFTLHRENIMKQCRGWAEKNREVESLLPTLQVELEKQSLPDGTRPIYQLPTSPNSPASGASSTPAKSASATPVAPTPAATTEATSPASSPTSQ